MSKKKQPETAEELEAAEKPETAEERESVEEPQAAEEGSRTTVSPEGFFEPFNIDAMPWRKVGGSTAFKRLGHYGGGSQVGVGIDVMNCSTTPGRIVCS